MKRAWIVGSGKRVVETALPVFAAQSTWELAGVASRRAKTIEAGGARHDVRALDALTRADLAGTELVYLVVSKPAVPSVVARVAELAPAGCALLIETPVMLFKHLGHLSRLDAFHATWVAEDCATLPCWDPVLALEDRARSAVFDRCAYAYHGVAMARTVLGGDRVASARRTPNGREVRFANGASYTAVEPRDYARGRLELRAPGWTAVTNGGESSSPAGLRRLAAVVEDGALAGFALDDVRCEMSAVERAVAGAPGAGDGMFRWMDAMKRVGFLRLLERIAAGGGGYSVRDAVEDCVVDYWLHRAGRYRATALMDPERGLARALYRALRVVARVD